MRGQNLVLSFILILFCLFSTACNSLHKKANRLMDEKVYDEAQKIYLEILRRDPKDAEALIGLKKSREAGIGASLIEVRQHRLGGNTDEANEELREILHSLRDWKVYPSGAVASTQADEIEFAIRDIERESQIALQGNFPFRVAFLIERYHEFFQDKRLHLLEVLRTRAAERGLENCRHGLSSSNKDLSFYREFLARSCIYWGDKQAELKTPIVHGLYNQIALSGQVSHLPEALRIRLENDLQTLFQESPWYDPAGPKRIQFIYDGAYQFSSERRSAVFTHAYEEEEPYTTTEFVTKHRSHPVTMTKTTVDASGRPVTTTGTEYVDETYSESETVTKLRTVTKSFDYRGTEIEQSFSLQTAIRTELAMKLTALTASVADRNMTSESQTSAPAKGLMVRVAHLKNENEWFVEQLLRWHKQNLDQLRDLWDRNYCQGFSADQTPAKQANSVFQCLRDTSKSPPPALESWLKTHEGVSVQQLRDVLKTL